MRGLGLDEFRSPYGEVAGCNEYGNAEAHPDFFSFGGSGGKGLTLRLYTNYI